MILTWPPQRSQVWMSMLKTRFRRCAQVMAACRSARLGDVLDEGFEFVAAWRADVAEGGRALCRDVDAVQHQEVEVNIQVQGAPEILDEGDGAGSGGVAGESRLVNPIARDPRRCGRMSSTSSAALSAMRRAPQLGQKPRPLQLKAAPQASPQRFRCRRCTAQT